MLLEQIQQANDIKKINPKDYPLLAEEIRQFLIEKISVTGGHLGSNLGACRADDGDAYRAESAGR